MAFLSCIRMKGFKTFARPTEMIFEQGVSVVIGPNGSGKSNIADAVLWALGEQSPTSLRGRSMQDVIFSGSDGQRPAAVAEVSLTFDNVRGVFPLDFQEVEISRRVTRDGASEYRINGVVSRLIDVEDLVGGVGLGREMHSVISQGRVDELVNSTPTTRRALVEEAAGLGRYKKRRDRALVKLEKVTANLLRVSDVEKEVRGALRPLRQQVTAAERFTEATEELSRLRAQAAVLALADLEGRIQSERALLDDVSARRAKTEGALQGLREERAREEARFTSALREREDLSALYHQASADVDRVRARGASLEQRVVRVEAELARARRRASLAVEEEALARARADALGEGPAQAAGRLRTVLSAGETLAARLDEVRPALGAAAQEEDALRDEVFGLEAERARALQEKDFLVREMEGRSRRAGELAESLRIASERLEEVRGVARKRTEMVQPAEAALASIEAEESAARERAATLRAQADHARENARTLTERLAAAGSRVAVLEELAARREGTPAAARAILASVPGAVLVVEALRVTPGYERAVAAALGPLASAVVAPGATDAGLVRKGEGLVEILWPEAARQLDVRAETASGAATEGIRPVSTGQAGMDLWEFVDGPLPVLRALKAILSETRVVSVDEASAGAGTGRAVSTEGELWHGQVHGARRGEAAAEALLAVRAELESVSAQEALLRSDVERAHEAAERRSEEAAAADSAAAAASARTRAARAERDALVDEVTLWGRRFTEVEAEAVEAEERRARDADLARELVEGSDLVEARLQDIAGRLEAARAGLRSVKESTQALQGEVAALEGKRSQATVLAVRLRERERARDEERERARTHLQRSQRALALARERENALEEYVPILCSLAEVVAPLVRALEDTVVGLSERLAHSRAATDDFADVLKDQGGRESDLQRAGSELNEELVRAQVALAHLEEQAAERRRELEELRRKHLSPREVDVASVADLDHESLTAAIERAERKRDRIGPVNPLAEQEFREMEERAGFLLEQRQDLEASLAELRTVIRDLDEYIESTFTEVFEATRAHFEEMVKILFPGGRGILRLVEVAGARAEAEEGDEVGSDDEAVAGPGPGIALEIKPPRKSPRNMNLLSGGEKALAAIAFLFGLFLARPCPFYVLDEVEAALDDLNLGRFLSLVRRYQQRTQFIVITHQRRTMEIADRLYGVALDGDGTSRVLSRRLAAEGTAGART